MDDFRKSWAIEKVLVFVLNHFALGSVPFCNFFSQSYFSNSIFFGCGTDFGVPLPWIECREVHAPLPAGAQFWKLLGKPGFARAPDRVGRIPSRSI